MHHSTRRLLRPLPSLVAAVLLLGTALLTQSSAQTGSTEAKTQPGVTYLDPAEVTRSPRYSQVAVVNNGRLVLISGQIATDAKGELVGRGDIRKQSEQIFANIRYALKAAGADVGDIVNIRTDLLSLADLPGYREARQAFLSARKNPPPTSTTVQVAGLVTEGALLEVTVMAVIPERQAKKRSVGR